MSTEATKSTTTKPKETQVKSAQPQQAFAPTQEMMGLGMGASQLAMHNGSMAGQATLLSRLHPAQRTTMVQRMTRTHSNSHVSQIISRARAQEPKAETETMQEEVGPPDWLLEKYGMGSRSAATPPPADDDSGLNQLNTPAVQTKMTVNEVNDPFEQEADRVADQVMQSSAPVQRVAIEGDFSKSSQAQRATEGDPLGGTTVDSNVESRVNKLDGGGEPLPDSSRSFFESRMGADFSGVRIHRDASSAELSNDLNARAFTTGNNIAFNSGEYNPGTPDGDRLLAHELTHTVQQGASGQVARKVQREEAIEGEESAKPTPEAKAEALAAAAEAAAIADAARATGQSETAQSQGDASSKKSEGEGSKAEAAASVAAGPVQAEERKQLESKTEASTQAKKAASAAQQDAVQGQAEGAKQAALAQPPALATQPEPLSSAEGGAAPSGAGLEGATAAAQAKIEGAYSAADSAPDKAPASADEDQGYTASSTAAEAVGTEQQTHDPADGEADAAQAAAESPQAELAGQAQTAQVGALEQTETPEFDAAAFKAALMAKIENLAPKSPAEADDFKESGKVDAVKSDMGGQVEEERAASEGPLEEATQAPPDMSSAEPKTVTALDPVDAGPAPTEIGADKAVPKPKGEGEVEAPTADSSQALDQQMADANLTDEQLEKSNEPEFTGALSAKKEGQAQVATSTQTYRQEEQTQVSSAEAEAVSAAQSATQAMFDTRTSALTQVEGDQQQTKSGDEQARAKIAGDISRIYEKTKSNVDTILGNLDKEVTDTFDKGAEAASTVFEEYVDAQMEAYKEERYGGFWGWAKWAKDKITNSLPSEVNTFYGEGRDLYVAKMDAVIDNIVAIIGTTLAKAKAEVANGKREIQEYVDQLPEDLQKVGQEAAQEIQGKFDELEQQVNDKQGELIDTLAQKYSENLQALDSKIEAMEEANRGIFAGIIDAIGGVIQKILELKRMLEDVLARAQAAVQLIIDDPIGFLGNLIDAVQQGFNQFVDNIGAHLGKGLMSWITGTLTEAGIKLPETFDLQGIFQLVMQVAGISFDQIIGKLGSALGVDLNDFIKPVMQVIDIYNESGFAGLAQYGLGQIIGEENVESLMEVVNIVKMVISGNFEALWGLVKEHLSNLKEMIMGQIQDMVIKEVIEAGVKFVLSMFNPAGAFIKACMMIYDVVMFFVNHGDKIMALVNAVIDSVTSIASGDIGSAANSIETALASAIPVAIGFMSSLLGLGDLPQKIQGIIKGIRETIDNAINKILELPPIKAILGFIKKLIAKAKDLIAKGVDKVKDKLGLNGSKEEKAAVADIKSEEGKVAVDNKLTKADAKTVAANVKDRHPKVSSLTVFDGDDSWNYNIQVQRTKLDTKDTEKAEDSEEKRLPTGFVVGAMVRYPKPNGKNRVRAEITEVTNKRIKLKHVRGSDGAEAQTLLMNQAVEAIEAKKLVLVDAVSQEPEGSLTKEEIAAIQQQLNTVQLSFDTFLAEVNNEELTRKEFVEKNDLFAKKINNDTDMSEAYNSFKAKQGIGPWRDKLLLATKKVSRATLKDERKKADIKFKDLNIALRKYVKIRYDAAQKRTHDVGNGLTLSGQEIMHITRKVSLAVWNDLVSKEGSAVNNAAKTRKLQNSKDKPEHIDVETQQDPKKQYDVELSGDFLREKVNGALEKGETYKSLIKRIANNQDEEAQAAAQRLMKDIIAIPELNRDTTILVTAQKVMGVLSKPTGQITEDDVATLKGFPMLPKLSASGSRAVNTQFAKDNPSLKSSEDLGERYDGKKVHSQLAAMAESQIQSVVDIMSGKPIQDELATIKSENADEQKLKQTARLKEILKAESIKQFKPIIVQTIESGGD